MNLHSAICGLAENFGNASITLNANDDGTWTASMWFDTRTMFEFTAPNGPDALTALMERIEQVKDFE